MTGSDWKKSLLAVVLVISAATGVIFTVFDNPWEMIRSNGIITPVAFVAAAFANATAVGGGFLFVPLFIYVYGLTPLVALKLSLATQAFGMTSGSLGWSKRFIDTRGFLVGGAASLVGMYLGTYEWQIASEDIKPVFGWVSMVIFTAIMLEIYFGKGSQEHSIKTLKDLRLPGYILATFLGGVLTAWTAIGVGEVVALYLLFIYKVRMDISIGTGVAVLAVDSIAGLIFHSDLGGIPWELLVFTAPGVMLGGFFGARVGRFVEQKVLSPKPGLQPAKQGQSPLKWVFSLIVLVDGASILTNFYLFAG